MSVSSRGNESSQCLEPHFGRDAGLDRQDQTNRNPLVLAARPGPFASNSSSDPLKPRATGGSVDTASTSQCMAGSSRFNHRARLLIRQIRATCAAEAKVHHLSLAMKPATSSAVWPTP